MKWQTHGNRVQCIWVSYARGTEWILFSFHFQSYQGLSTRPHARYPPKQRSPGGQGGGGGATGRGLVFRRFGSKKPSAAGAARGAGGRDGGFAPRAPGSQAEPVASWHTLGSAPLGSPVSTCSWSSGSYLSGIFDMGLSVLELVPLFWLCFSGSKIHFRGPIRESRFPFLRAL